jgi:hypothetical protein
LNRGWRFCRFNGVVNRVVSCWSLVGPAPPFCLVFGPYWTTSGLRLPAIAAPPARVTVRSDWWATMATGGKSTPWRPTPWRAAPRSRRGVARGHGWITTTEAEARAALREDVVDQQFIATDPNQLWVSDFSYIATWCGTASNSPTAVGTRRCTTYVPAPATRRRSSSQRLTMIVSCRAIRSSSPRRSRRPRDATARCSFASGRRHHTLIDQRTSGSPNSPTGGRLRSHTCEYARPPRHVERAQTQRAVSVEPRSRCSSRATGSK